METIFDFFWLKKQFFRLVETGFLASTNNKLFFRLVETYFLTKPLFQLQEKDLLFSGNRLLYLKVLFY